eukprot:gene25003-23505_t
MHHLPNSYTEIVIDPSGRAKCMWCQSKITRGDCRFEDVTVGQGYNGQDMSCKIHVGCYRIPAKVPKTEAGRLAWLTSDVRGFKVLDAAK